MREWDFEHLVCGFMMLPTEFGISLSANIVW